MDSLNHVNRKVSQPSEPLKSTTKPVQEKANTPSAGASSKDAPQIQQRNIHFKLNEDENEMYVEITDENDEVVRVIPADESDPKFQELLKQIKPGSIINDRS